MFRPLPPGRVGNKWERVGYGNCEVASIHVPDVYADGSYAEEAPGEDFTGYGIWFGPMHPHNVSAPLLGPTQTNNRGDLTACVEALCAPPPTHPPPVIADSKYVYNGVTAYMHRWVLQGR